MFIKDIIHYYKDKKRLEGDEIDKAKDLILRDSPCRTCIYLRVFDTTTGTKCFLCKLKNAQMITGPSEKHVCKYYRVERER